MNENRNGPLMMSTGCLVFDETAKSWMGTLRSQRVSVFLQMLHAFAEQPCDTVKWPTKSTDRHFDGPNVL